MQGSLFGPVLLNSPVLKGAKKKIEKRNVEVDFIVAVIITKEPSSSFYSSSLLEHE